MQRGRRDADICFHRPHAFVQLTAVAVLVASLLPSTWATPRPLTQGPTGLGQFANYTSALEVPSVKSAWIVERVVDCENPFVWLTFRAGKKSQKLHVSAGVPYAARLEGLRVSATLFGPGLPKRAKARRFAVPVPKSKRSTPLGALDLPPPADVTSCTFVRNKFVGAQSLPYKGRCVFTEPFPTETRSYLVLDTNVTLAAKGTYHLVAHLTQPSSGRFWISVSDWSTGADYLSTYDAPVGAAPDGEDFFRKRPPAPACCVPDADCSAPLSVYAR